MSNFNSDALTSFSNAQAFQPSVFENKSQGFANIDNFDTNTGNDDKSNFNNVSTAMDTLGNNIGLDYVYDEKKGAEFELQLGTMAACAQQFLPCVTVSEYQITELKDPNYINAENPTDYSGEALCQQMNKVIGIARKDFEKGINHIMRGLQGVKRAAQLKYCYKRAVANSHSYKHYKQRVKQERVIATGIRRGLHKNRLAQLFK